MPTSPPASVAVRAVDVAGATLSMLLRGVAGVIVGLGLGSVVFFVEKYAGWLDGGGGWTWLLWPIDALTAAASLGFGFAMAGLRKALQSLLVDSGVLRGMVERGLARVRKADERHAAEAEAGEAPAPPGWLGSRIHGFGRSASRVIVENLRSTASPQAETAVTIDATARALIDEWGETLVYLAYAGVALAWIGPPLVLAFTT